MGLCAPLAGELGWQCTGPGLGRVLSLGEAASYCPVLPHDCNIKSVFLNDISQGPFEPLVSSLGRALPSLTPSWCMKCSTGLDLAQLRAAPARSHVKSQSNYKVGAGGNLAPALDTPCISRSEWPPRSSNGQTPATEQVCLFNSKELKNRSHRGAEPDPRPATPQKCGLSQAGLKAAGMRERWAQETV